MYGEEDLGENRKVQQKPTSPFCDPSGLAPLLIRLSWLEVDSRWVALGSTLVSRKRRHCTDIFWQAFSLDTQCQTGFFFFFFLSLPVLLLV